MSGSYRDYGGGDVASSCPLCDFAPGNVGEDELILHIETQHPEDKHTRGQKEVPPRAVSEAERMGKDHDGGDALRPSSSARSAERKKQEKQREQEQQTSRPRSKGSKGSRKTSSGASSRSKPSSSSSSSSRASRRILPFGSGGNDRGSGGDGGVGGESKSGSGSGGGAESRNHHPGLLEVWKSIFRGHHSRHGGAGGEKRSGPRRTRHKSKNLTPATDGTAGDGDGDVGSKDQAVPSARLGRAELGRHVNEKQMPASLVSLLETPPHSAEGIIPVLQQVLEKSPSTTKAYLCSPHTLHVSKLRKEGSFCGYRNIQMLVSYLTRSGSPGAEHFAAPFPSVAAIQELIEGAWDKGINAQGRAETGGIRGTRKWIGTPEAQTIALSLGLPCSVQAFKDDNGKPAREKLTDAIERYFASGAHGADGNGDGGAKVCATDLPPVYLQHPGHSMTIVGLERTAGGAANLLVFDPAYRDPPAIRALVGGASGVRSADGKVGKGLQEYRRGYRHLRRYREFELLYLVKGIQP